MFLYENRLILEDPDLLDVSCRNKPSSAQHKGAFSIFSPISDFRFFKKWSCCSPGCRFSTNYGNIISSVLETRRQSFGMKNCLRTGPTRQRGVCLELLSLVTGG